MTVAEPATLLTDCLLAALAGTLATRLHFRTSADALAARWWTRVLALTAAAGVLGGTSHGFGPMLPSAVADGLWLATLLTLNLTSAALGAALVRAVVPPASARLWLVVVALKLAGFAAYVVFRPEFVVAILDYGLALLAWLLATMLTRKAWRGWMGAAVGFSVVAAVIQQAQLGFTAWFNHNDLYHVVQAAALVCFYRAARRL